MQKGKALGPCSPSAEPLGGGSDQNSLFAAMECPPNSHYEVCADTCSLGCSALSAPPHCPESCAEGCQCDPGFLSNGQGCVPIQQCGCFHNGVYYEVGTRSWQAEPGASCGTPFHCPSPHSLSTWPPEYLSHPTLPLPPAPLWSH